MVALLMFAAGFALGLFFGWLLHRERVERALYEDVARHRDRATAALAETSARLELANKDMIRLRSQLADSQQLLDERDATIADLRTRGPDRPTGDDDAVADGVTGGPVDAAADAATTPSGVTRLDDVDQTDITEEVTLAAGATDTSGSAPDADVMDDSDHTIDVTPAAAAGSAAVTDDLVEGQPAPDVQDEPAVTTPADGEPVDDGPAGAEQVGDEAPEGDGAEPAVGAPLDDAADAVVGTPPAGEAPAVETGIARDLPAGEVPAVEPLPEPSATDAAVDAVTAGVAAYESLDAAGAEEEQPEIGDPLVVDASDQPAADAAPPAGPDDLQRIAGIGPALELQLQAEGITTYRRLALLDDETVADLRARRPQLVRRMRRGGWAVQARRLHAETHGESL